MYHLEKSYSVYLCRNRSISAFVIILYVSSMYLLARHFNLVTSRSAPDSSTNDVHQRTRNILLYASYRSGSSFLGELFRQNPRVHYLFEPLRFAVLNDDYDDSGWPHLEKHLSKYVSDAFNCSYHDLLSDSKRLFPNKKKRLLWMDRAFRQPIQRHNLERPTVLILEQTCQQYNVRVQKIIRARRLHNILPVILNNDVDVIVLVRDPRALSQSALNIELKRKNISSDEQKTILLERTRKICEKYNDTISFLKTSVDTSFYELFAEKVVLVRYEDVASSPQEKARRLYGRLRLAYPDTLDGWITEATSGGESLGDTGKVLSEFSTSRQSRETAEKWRLKIDLAIVLQMQTVCGDIMQVLGYAPVTSEQQLHNMNTSLVIQPSDVIRQWII